MTLIFPASQVSARRARVLLAGSVAIACTTLLVATLSAQEIPASLPAAATAPAVLSTQEASPPAATTPAATAPAATAPTVSAPSTQAAAGTQPAEEPTTLAFNPNAKATFNFQDARVEDVLNKLSSAMGFEISQEDKITGRVTVMKRQPIGAEEAIDLLNAELKRFSVTIVQSGRKLRIMTREKAKKANLPVRFGSDPAKIKQSEELITQVIPLGSVDAVKLKADLTPMFSADADVTANAGSNTIIITDSSASIRRIVEIIAAMDRHLSDSSDIKVFQLKYASATAAAKLIMDVFKPDEPVGQQLAVPRRFGGGGGGGFGGGGFGGGGFGPPAPAATPDSSSASRGGKVVASADERTNTLVVTGPKETLTVVERVVKELDSNPTEERSVFVYPLRNGQAKRLESVLNNLFGASTNGSSSSLGNSRNTSGTSGSYQRTTGGQPLGGTRGSIGSGSSSGLGSSAFGGGAGGGFGTGGRTTGGGGATYNPFAGGFGGGGAALSTTARGALGDLVGQAYVVADEDTNSLLITTSPKLYERVKLILAELDHAVPQVVIKVLIAEVTHNKGVDYGLEASYVNTRLNGMGTKVGTDFGLANSSGGLAISMLEGDFKIALKALATAGKVDVLSRPYILASDNQLASILVGQQVPFITNSRTTDTGGIINTVQYQDIGIILNVTPHINPDGKVIMDVAPEISALTNSSVTISAGVTSPIFTKRSAQSRVAIDNGKTIVIGGLMEDRKTMTEDKVPFLGDIPWLGEAFKHKIENKTKTELLIFLTPHVAMDSMVMPNMSKDEVRGLNIVPKAVAPGVFDEHMQGMQRGATTQPEPIYEPSSQPAPRPLIPPPPPFVDGLPSN